jgi:DNA-binding beta-propeller fold protein YncE
MENQRIQDMQSTLAGTRPALEDRQKVKVYIGAVFVLGLILLALLYLYYMLSSPPQALKAEKPKGFNHLFSIYGFGKERLGRPSDVAVARNGDIYVADTDNHRIVVFDKEGKFLREHRNYGKGKGQFEYPNAIDVAGNGNIYLVSKTLNKLMILSSGFKTIREIEVDKPIEVKVHGKRLLVGTYRGIIQADLNGNLISGFGKRGTAKGEFDFPRGLAADEKNNIYVADSLNYRVQALTAKGKPIWVVGQPVKDIMAAKRRFSLPVSIEMADDGYLYLVDAFAAEILVLDPQGKQVARYGEWGHDEGFFYYPGGMAYAGDEKFVIADTYNDRVQVVQIPSPAASLFKRATRSNWIWLIAAFILLLSAYLVRRYWRRFRAARKKEDASFGGEVEGEVIP